MAIASHALVGVNELLVVAFKAGGEQLAVVAAEAAGGGAHAFAFKDQRSEMVKM